MLDTFLREAHHYVLSYGYAAVFVGIFLESFGLPTPGETLMIAGSLMASEGKLDLRVLLALSWFATVMGANIGYVIGRQGGRPLVLRYGSRLGVKRSHLDHVEGFFDRHGGAVVLFARFIVPLRQLNGIVAGILGMSWWRFLACNAAGAALWVAFWSLAAYWFGRGLIHLMHGVAPIVVTAAAIGAAVAAFVLWIVRRGAKARSRR